VFPHILKPVFSHQATPFVTNFLRSVERMLTDWKEGMPEFPVVSWTQFVDAVHKKVNPLVTTFLLWENNFGD